MKNCVVLCCVALCISSIEPLKAQVFNPLIGTSESCVDNNNSIFNRTVEGSDVNTDSPVVTVGFLGDPGTWERNNAISFHQNWALDQFVGIQNPTLKLGLYDEPLPVGSSGIAVKCQEAGFLINTFQFSHTQPVQGGGPQGSYGIKKFMPRRAFESSSSQLIIQGYVKHPNHHWDEPDAVGQLVLAYYMQPLTCYRHGTPYECQAASVTNNIPAFAHVIALYDSRNLIGTYDEYFDNDTFSGFFSSPLANYQQNGSPPQFLKKSIYSAPMATAWQTWSGYNFFRAEISYEKMSNMISIFRNNAPAAAAVTSPDPIDWGIVLITGLVETAPRSLQTCIKNNNAPGCLNIAMATSFASIDAFRAEGLTRSNIVGPTPLGLPPINRQEKPMPSDFTRQHNSPVMTHRNFRSLLGQ